MAMLVIAWEFEGRIQLLASAIINVSRFNKKVFYILWIIASAVDLLNPALSFE